MDYPTAWEIIKNTNQEDHHQMCSYRQSDGCILCDCYVIEIAELKTELARCQLTKRKPSFNEDGWPDEPDGQYICGRGRIYHEVIGVLFEGRFTVNGNGDDLSDYEWIAGPIRVHEPEEISSTD